MPNSQNIDVAVLRMQRFGDCVLPGHREVVRAVSVMSSRRTSALPPGRRKQARTAGDKSQPFVAALVTLRRGVTRPQKNGVRGGYAIGR